MVGRGEDGDGYRRWWHVGWRRWRLPSLLPDLVEVVVEGGGSGDSRRWRRGGERRRRFPSLLPDPVEAVAEGRGGDRSRRCRVPSLVLLQVALAPGGGFSSSQILREGGGNAAAARPDMGRAGGGLVAIVFCSPKLFSQAGGYDAWEDGDAYEGLCI